MSETRPRATVLVTRPEPENAALCAALTGEGFAAIACPLQAVRPIEAALPSLARYRGVLFSSVNGVRAFAARTQDRTLPAWCVGEVTAAAARSAGFGEVRAADGDGASLVQLIARAGGGPLLHVSGAATAVDFAAMLQPAGVQVDRIALYDAAALPRLPANAASALAQGSADAVLLYSPRAAALFSTHAAHDTMRHGAQRLTAVCLSSAVASAVTFDPARLFVSAARSDAAMRDALDGAFPA